MHHETPALQIPETGYDEGAEVISLLRAVSPNLKDLILGIAIRDNSWKEIFQLIHGGMSKMEHLVLGFLQCHLEYRTEDGRAWYVRLAKDKSWKAIESAGGREMVSLDREFAHLKGAQAVNVGLAAIMEYMAHSKDREKPEEDNYTWIELCERAMTRSKS